MTKRSILYNGIALSVGLVLGWFLFGGGGTLAAKSQAPTSAEMKPEGEAPARINSPPRMDHILLEVSDMQASLAFYQNMLGLLPKNLTDDFSTLAAGNMDIYLSTNPWEWKAPRGKDERPGLGLYPHFEVPDVREIAARVKGAGHKIVQEPKEYEWGTEAFVADPDGYTWALVSWKKGT